MLIPVEVRSQLEFDAAIKDGNIAVVIGCSVVAWENSSVEARENSSVEARENSSVVARENSSVVARGNSSVEARGNSSVVAWENSSVEAWENSSVVARGNSSVVARGNVFIRLFSAISIRASLSVVILKHGEAKQIDGGNQLEAALEPTIGSEWCEFNGIDPNEADYKIQHLDAKILEQIEKTPSNFDMRDWHGANCDETNWCQTTHCRAGYAICLAGKAGFALQAKHGAEIAGRMIYAVSRPNDRLPDFFASTEGALADIKRSAAKDAAVSKESD